MNTNRTVDDRTNIRISYKKYSDTQINAITDIATTNTSVAVIVTIATTTITTTTSSSSYCYCHRRRYFKICISRLLSLAASVGRLASSAIVHRDQLTCGR